MHLQTGKKFRFFIYIFIIIFLTSINNYNFYNKKIFNIKYIEVTGFTDKKNTTIKDEIKSIIGKNIFFIEKNYFNKIINRNDTKDLAIKKIYPNKIKINLFPAKPICIVIYENNRIILGDNGKKLDIDLLESKIPTVVGSNNIKNIYETVSLLKNSKLNDYVINKIVFFKSGRFDVNLDNGILIKFPIKYSKRIINYSSNILNDKTFSNSKIIDLRLKNKIIINE